MTVPGAVKPVLRVPVRAVVEHVLRSGDLDSDSAGPARLDEAVRAHREIQDSRPPGYRKEVPVSVTREEPDFVLALGGRIDGLREGPDGILIEEIKTTTTPLEEIERETQEVHWAQARFYAYMYTAGSGFSKVRIRLTYCHLETRRTSELEQDFGLEELQNFFEETLARYLEWLTVVVRWRRIRDRSFIELPFPYPETRPGQLTLAEAVYVAIRDKGRLLVQAPTGIGKTMAVVFPAAQALARGLAGRIFYLVSVYKWTFFRAAFREKSRVGGCLGRKAGRLYL
ncbi:MAG: PD-(D/E)XK nuclease family protein [Thermodesulfobacteriota bacterium]